MIGCAARLTLCSLMLFLVVTSCLGQGAPAKPSEQMSSLRRQEAIQTLHDALDVIKKEYYDSGYHGIDVQARMREAEKHMQEAGSLSEAFGVIAWYFEGLSDSHTFFVPPPRPFDIQIGWQLEFISDNCFITAVQPGSDAATQGLKPGDQVLMIEGFRPTRETLWKLRYAFNVLAPRSAMHLAVVSPGGQPRQLLVKSAVKELHHQLEFTNDFWDLVRKLENLEEEGETRSVELGDVMVVKIPEFSLEDEKVDRIIDKANHHSALVLDLRGNPGGRMGMLERLTGDLFDHDVKIADMQGRKEKRSVSTKSHGDRAFKGKLVVLVDAGSASAAELLARTIQLEKRGVVMGDRSSGSVMAAKIFPYQQGDGEFHYSFEVTVSDLLMTDGHSLEHMGVTPDELTVPTAEDLAANRDPVLAHAVESLGGSLTPDAAGKLFPVIWHKPQ